MQTSPCPRVSLICANFLCTAAVNQTADKAYYLFDGYAHFASGLACGLAGLGAGMAIGIVGDAGVRWVLPAGRQQCGTGYARLLVPPPDCSTGAHAAIVAARSSWLMMYAHAACRANAQQPKLFVGMILILIFAEALALYGLIGKSGRRIYMLLYGPRSVPFPFWQPAACGALRAALLAPHKFGMQNGRAAAASCDRCSAVSHSSHSRPPVCCCAVGIILASKAGTATPM